MYYLTADKEWLLENYPKMTLKQLVKNKMIQNKPFKEETGNINKKTKKMEVTIKQSKNTFTFKDDHTCVDVKMTKATPEGMTIIEFTSFDTNYHLVVQTGEFMELYNIINEIKEQL
jgi:hypothetical protein